jgi:hypothetical protein
MQIRQVAVVSVDKVFAVGGDQDGADDFYGFFISR